MAIKFLAIRKLLNTKNAKNCKKYLINIFFRLYLRFFLLCNYIIHNLSL